MSKRDENGVERVVVENGLVVVSAPGSSHAGSASLRRQIKEIARRVWSDDEDAKSDDPGSGGNK